GREITLALRIKAVFFVLAVFGSATMWMAVFADTGASLRVVDNGLRRLRKVRDRSMQRLVRAPRPHAIGRSGLPRLSRRQRRCFTGRLIPCRKRDLGQAIR
ncbi:MAG TPA: hypothetical protein VMR43_16170, partial [Variovorax sp.]|nr:hypothetical protein [Variovorax sp.]